MQGCELDSSGLGIVRWTSVKTPVEYYQLETLVKAVLAYFPKVGLCDIHAVCVSVCVQPFINFECLNQTL
jgi:hypothetical protein